MRAVAWPATLFAAAATILVAAGCRRTIASPPRMPLGGLRGTIEVHEMSTGGPPGPMPHVPSGKGLGMDRFLVESADDEVSHPSIDANICAPTVIFPVGRSDLLIRMFASSVGGGKWPDYVPAWYLTLSRWVAGKPRRVWRVMLQRRRKPAVPPVGTLARYLGIDGFYLAPDAPSQARSLVSGVVRGYAVYEDHWGDSSFYEYVIRPDGTVTKAERRTEEDWSLVSRIGYRITNAERAMLGG